MTPEEKARAKAHDCVWHRLDWLVGRARAKEIEDVVTAAILEARAEGRLAGLKEHVDLHAPCSLCRTTIRALAQRAESAAAGDDCEVCKGKRGGVRGNEQIIDGKVMCDYCHADTVRTGTESAGPLCQFCGGNVGRFATSHGKRIFVCATVSCQGSISTRKPSPAPTERCETCNGAKSCPIISLSRTSIAGHLVFVGRVPCPDCNGTGRRSP